MPRIREKDVQEKILLHVGSRPYLRLWRQNVGVARSMDGARVIRYGQPGAADLTGVLACGVRLELEIKRPGGRQTKDQKRFQGVMDAMGAVYGVADSEAAADSILDSHLQGCSVCRGRTRWEG